MLAFQPGYRPWFPGTGYCQKCGLLGLSRFCGETTRIVEAISDYVLMFVKDGWACLEGVSVEMFAGEGVLYTFSD